MGIRKRTWFAAWWVIVVFGVLGFGVFAPLVAFVSGELLGPVGFFGSLFVMGVGLSCAMMYAGVRSCSKPAGVCDVCGYDLTGNVSGVCPECGRFISDAHLRDG